MRGINVIIIIIITIIIDPERLPDISLCGSVEGGGSRRRRRNGWMLPRVIAAKGI